LAIEQDVCYLCTTINGTIIILGKFLISY